jgi:DNA-3-methyladenine glycosylase
MPEVKRFSKNGTVLKTRSRIEMSDNKKLTQDFFRRDVLLVAPGLIGKILVVIPGENSFRRFMITETEAYRGDVDEACHASKGRTARTEVMYHEGGNIYVYFVYGMYWMLNFVAGEKDDPQAVLIRGIEGFSGPGRVTKALNINRSYYGEDLTTSKRIWVEDAGIKPVVKTSPRIGINYAGEIWKNKPWRYLIDPKSLNR